MAADVICTLSAAFSHASVDGGDQAQGEPRVTAFIRRHPLRGRTVETALQQHAERAALSARIRTLLRHDALAPPLANDLHHAPGE